MAKTKAVPAKEPKPTLHPDFINGLCRDAYINGLRRGGSTDEHIKRLYVGKLDRDSPFIKQVVLDTVNALLARGHVTIPGLYPKEGDAFVPYDAALDPDAEAKSSADMVDARKVKVPKLQPAAIPETNEEETTIRVRKRQRGKTNDAGITDAKSNGDGGDTGNQRVRTRKRR